VLSGWLGKVIEKSLEGVALVGLSYMLYEVSLSNA
jgi:hypothetical protein